MFAPLLRTNAIGLHSFIHIGGNYVITSLSPFRVLAVTALVSFSGASQAALTVYTSQANFLAAVNAPGTDSYTGFSLTGSTPSPITRSAGSYQYTATAETSSFFGAGTTANPWLSTNTAADTITFNAFTGGANAIGGNFFGSDINGIFSSGNITLVATDSLGATSSQTIVGATTTSFLGFVSSGTIASLVVQSVQGASPLWPTVDNLTLAVAVPEPGTHAMLLAGLGVVGLMARRRRS